MSATRVAILALLVAALGAWLYWVEMPEVTRERAGTTVVDLKADEVTRVAITFPDRRFELTRRDDDWRLTAPLEADADDTQVKSLVTALTTAKVDRTLEDTEGDRSVFGLGEDAPRVELETTTGHSATVTVGRQTPIGSKTYVVVAGSPAVELTPSNLRATIDKQPGDLRDKRLLDFEDDAVTRVEATSRQGDRVVLRRVDGDDWSVGPGDHVADLTEVRSYLSSLRATRAVTFVEESPVDLAPFGLADPRLRIAVFTGADEPAAVLLLGDEYEDGTSTRLYAKLADRPNVVGLGEWSLRSLQKDVGSLRDKTILGFDPDRVGRFEIRRADGSTTTVERGDEGWRLAGDGGEVDQATVTRYLDDLRELKGSGIAAEPAPTPLGFGLDEPAVHVTLTDREGAPLGEIIAAKVGENHYAMRVGADLVFELRDYMYARIDKARDAFAPLPPPPGS